MTTCTFLYRILVLNSAAGQKFGGGRIIFTAGLWPEIRRPWIFRRRRPNSAARVYVCPSSNYYLFVCLFVCLYGVRKPIRYTHQGSRGSLIPLKVGAIIMPLVTITARENGGFIIVARIYDMLAIVANRLCLLSELASPLTGSYITLIWSNTRRLKSNKWDKLTLSGVSSSCRVFRSSAFSGSRLKRPRRLTKTVTTNRHRRYKNDWTQTVKMIRLCQRVTDGRTDGQADRQPDRS